MVKHVNGHDDAEHRQRNGRHVGGDVGAHGGIVNHVEDPNAVLLSIKPTRHPNPEAETAFARLLGKSV